MPINTRPLDLVFDQLLKPFKGRKTLSMGGPISNSLRGRGLDIFWNYTFQTKLNVKQTYFSYSLDKAFHSPEFQAKLFFTQN